MNDPRDESGENRDVKSGLYADGPVLPIDGRGGSGFWFRLAIARGATEGICSKAAVVGISFPFRSRVSSSTHRFGDTASRARARSGTAKPLLTRLRRSSSRGLVVLSFPLGVIGYLLRNTVIESEIG